jgi:hypothetical protein
MLSYIEVTECLKSERFVQLRASVLQRETVTIQSWGFALSIDLATGACDTPKQ